MRKDEVKIDGTYLAKVGGGVVPVRITAEKWQGDKHVGRVGVNTLTNRSVRIKSAQRLRGPAGGQEADGAATTPDAGEGAARPRSLRRRRASPPRTRSPGRPAPWTPPPSCWPRRARR